VYAGASGERRADLKKKEYIVLVHIQRPHTCVLKLQERAQKSAAYCCICVSLILYCSKCVTLVLYCCICIPHTVLLYICHAHTVLLYMCLSHTVLQYMCHARTVLLYTCRPHTAIYVSLYYRSERRATRGFFDYTTSADWAPALLHALLLLYLRFTCGRSKRRATRGFSSIQLAPTGPPSATLT
jgi:hypothetical protein